MDIQTACRKESLCFLNRMIEVPQNKKRAPGLLNRLSTSHVHFADIAFLVTLRLFSGEIIHALYTEKAWFLIAKISYISILSLFPIRYTKHFHSKYRKNMLYLLVCPAVSLIRP